MSEELEQVGTGGEDIQGGAASPDTSGEGTQEGITLTPELKALIEAEVGKQREVWEGQLKKVQSSKDKEVAAMKRQLREQQQQAQARAQQEFKQAQGLMRTDPARAAQMMAALYESQEKAATVQNQTQQMAGWMEHIMGDLGLSTEDDDTAAFAGEWFEKLIEDPNLSHDFHMAAALRVKEAKDKEIRQAQRELKEERDKIPEMVKQEVTRLLADAGFAPSPDDGGTPPERKDEWRNLSSGKLIAQGLEERRRR